VDAEGARRADAVRGDTHRETALPPRLHADRVHDEWHQDRAEMPVVTANTR